MVYLPEERVALWPWANDCCDKSAITADDLHFWVEEPNAPQANLDLAEFLHTAFVTTVAYSAFAVSAYAVSASQTQQAEFGHEEPAQYSAVASASKSDKKVELRWADIDDTELEEGPNFSEQKPLGEEFGQIQEMECSEAHVAARKGLGGGESQVDTSQSLPFVRAFFWLHKRAHGEWQSF